MLDIFLDYFKKLAKSRLFPVTLIYLVLFGVIINRLFFLQIVEGPEISVESELKYAKQRDVKSTRGNIYDRNGVLLATNKLSYSVVMEGVSISSNAEYNSVIDKVVKLIEQNGDSLATDFYIRINDKGEFEFTVQGKALTRFLEKAYTYVLKDDKLTEEQKNSTAEEVFNFLKHGTGNAVAPMFGISDDYSKEEALKIMSVRYALLINYPKYLQVTIASEVTDKTVAAIKENSSELRGVDIQQQSSRVYVDSLYYSHILGYTGLISSDELEAKEKAVKANEIEENTYNSTDMIGKSGIEQVYESYLSGKKGTETVTLNASGRVTEIQQTKDPIAGDDLYLTIDSVLQKNVYLLLEKEITNILLTNIVPTMSYGSKGDSASEITIPIYEVYNALINNNILDVNAFDDSDATDLEKSTKTKYEAALQEIELKYNNLLALGSTTTNDKAGDMEDFLNYFYSVLVSNKVLIKSNIPENDTTYQAYINNNISLSAFLQSALANNWIDLSILGVGDEYYSAEELYQKLIDYTKNLLKEDNKFQKMIYRNLIFSYKLSGTEICLLLFDQGVLEYNESEINKLRSGTISSYKFITDKIRALKITPGMLALEPCSGSVVITDKKGDVLAMVTYPSYDNNLFANKINSAYYNKLLNDHSYPLLNRAVSTRTAPGSTFKMVTAVAALAEGVTNPSEKIHDLGQFTKISPSPKCHIYPGSHGNVNIVDALKVSCNYFFFEMGWRLSIDSAGKYDSDLGLTKLKKYATQFGLDETSGVELNELGPQISTKDAVRSTIGQGSNNYTPAQMSKYITTLATRGTCYNLTLLDKIEDKDGTVILDNSATVDHDLTDVSDSTWDTVWEGMYAVTNVAGGSVYSDYSNFDVKVAGKTGTSQISKTHANNALFVSFAPYENPEISVTTVIPNGYTSHNAADLTKKIYSLYFKKADAKTLLDENANANSNGGALE